MTTNTHEQRDPWRDEAQIFRAVAIIALLIFGGFVVYDGRRFHERYMSRCREAPDRPECGSLFAAKRKPSPELGIILDNDSGKWAIQLERMDRKTANERASRLREAGANPRLIRTTSPKGSSAHYLQLGRFKTQREAIDAGNRLKARGLLKTFAIGIYRFN